GKDQARARIEAFGGMEGQGGAAKHALEAVHQVVVTDQAQVAAFAESDTNLVADHAWGFHLGPWRSGLGSDPRGPGRHGPGSRTHSARILERGKVSTRRGHARSRSG